ncbi:MAG TPA: heme ABC exporter ATP-binding protein CcmA [Thermoanaerobaculia bacterium]|jgi:heme exporter protein A|nr:heme ABC exporter ATP-binding protein CcmA [Thermoanaerobaculia bacterium]
MEEAAIDVERLSRRYGRRWALADVTFRVESGTVVMVAGRNGAGKSTLFRVLATAIRPDRGTVKIEGFDVVRDREDVRRRTAILSHASYLYDSLTAKENLHIVADHLKIARSGVMGVLGQVGLAARADDVVATFSAGMRKRLSFGRILLQEPSVVLLDEPYGALDPAGFDLVDDVVRELKRRGATILMATHQWERSASLSDAALVLDGGRVVFQGAPAEALKHEPRADVVPLADAGPRVAAR